MIICAPDMVPEVATRLGMTETQIVGYRARTRSKRKTRVRMLRVIELLQRDGCVSVSVLMRALRISHSQAYHLMRVAVVAGGVKLRLGRTAILCRDRAEVEALVRRLKETVHRLANGMKYVTPTAILRATLRDRDAYALLSRFISLRRGMSRFPPAVLAFANDLLRLLYGEPLLHTSRKTVYLVSEPRNFNSVDKEVASIYTTAAAVRVNEFSDVEEMPIVTFHLPRALLQALDEYARRMNVTRSDVIRMAIRQMLEKMRAAEEKE